jgi:hypothetical protein
MYWFLKKGPAWIVRNESLNESAIFREPVVLAEEIVAIVHGACL